MDENDEEETEEYEGTVNWADWANVALTVPIYIVSGVLRALKQANGLLDLTSRNIDKRKDFSNAVHEAIEHINDEGKNG